MTNLTAYKSTDGVELYIDNTTGEAFASQRAIARMCEVDAVYIRRFVTATNIEGISAEILTDAGLRSAKLHSENTILQCVAKYNPQLLLLFSKAGLRVYLHGVTDFKVTSTAVVEHKLPGTYKDAVRALLESLDKAEALEAEVGVLEAEVKFQAPKVKVADDFISNEGLTTIEQFSKDLAIKDLGRNKLYTLLRELSVLGQNNQPYQQFVAKGLFVVKPTGSYKDNYGETVQTYKTFLTASGVEWLIAKFSRMGIN